MLEIDRITHILIAKFIFYRYGSPIIQNDKIIGEVTHVVVDKLYKEYGIFITNMLEKAEEG